MRMRLAILAAAFFLVVSGTAIVSLVAQKSAAKPVVEVFKSPTCGCCGAWVAHLEQNGFDVKSTNVRDMTAVKRQAGVPRALASCHTALVDGYIVEGHVPADDVKRLLSERPDVAGISVPGMPIGSPGMEGPNPHPYDVLAFDEDGSVTHFASH